VKVSNGSGWVAWFASNPVAANLMMAVVLVAGIVSALNLRVEAFPPLPPNSVTVSVSFDSGSAKSAESAVTQKLEEALQGIPGIKEIYSLSDANGSTVNIERTSGYDLDLLYQDIKNRVDGIATLPEQVEKPVITREIYLEDAVTVHLFGDADTDALHQLARQLKDKMLANPAIERVNTYGRETPELTIQVDEARLQSLGLSVADIGQRIASSSLIESGGELFSKDGLLVVKADQQRYRSREFADILIKESPQGQRILLGDIATVSDGYEQSAIISRFNGQPAIGLDIKMYSSSDIMAISREVAEIVESFRASLPANVQAEIWNDQSHYISNRLTLLLENSVLGILLVMFLLALFMNLRVAFWVAAGLPVTFAGAMLLMDPRIFNLTLNELTTFGFIIALGIVVDDAVVVGESIHSEREHHGPTLAATIRGAQRVAVPTVFGVLTTIVAFLALALVEGEMGTIFSFFAYAAAFCLIFSILESKFILPAHLSSTSTTTSPKRPVGRLWYRLQQYVSRSLKHFTQRIYRPFINRVLQQPYSTTLLAVALFILVIGLIPSGKVRAVFFPDIPSDYIVVEMSFEDQAGLTLIQQQAIAVERAAEQVNQLVTAAHNLSVEPIPHRMTVTDDRSALIIVGLSPRTERPLGTDELAERWRQQLDSLEAVRKIQFITAWEGEADISIQLHSKDTDSLQQASTAVRHALAQLEGVSGIQNSMKAARAQIDLKLSPEGEAMGFTIAMLARQIQHAYQGYEVQRMQRGRDEVKIKVRYPDHKRQRIEDLKHARLRSPNGQVVPLEVVAEIHSTSVATEIERIDGNRVAIITADVDKSIAAPAEILTSLDAELFQRLRQDYPQLDIRLSGEAQEEAETRNSLKGAFLVALLAIYALLAIPLGSYLQPLLIMSAIPFGIIGALFGHWLHGIPLSVLSMFGILALSGVVVNDSLLLISRYNDLRAAGVVPREAMTEAGCSRMRAIILTSITTFAGLVPLIGETAENAQFLIPAAIAMGYGILFATLITLVLIPTLIMVTEDLKSRRTSWFKTDKMETPEREMDL